MSDQLVPGRPVGRTRARSVPLALAILGLLLVALSITSLMLGARPISVSTVRDAFLHYDPGMTDHIVVRQYRLPRTILCLLCGAAFGTAGALIQASTRNPLADPGILGVNAGAAFAVILAVGVFSFASITAYVWFALAGAAMAGLLVYTIGASAGGATPVRLLLSGIAISAVLGGIGSSVTLLDPQAFDSLRNWQVGTVAGRNLAVAATVAICLVLLIMNKFNWFKLDVQRQVVKVQVPPEPGFEALVEDVLIEFCTEFELVSTESVRAGALNELYYTAQLRKGKKASELIAALGAVNTGQRVTVLTGYDQTDI